MLSVQNQKGEKFTAFNGEIALFRVGPTLPFQNVSVDLVGHFSFRTQTMSWGPLYLCDVSKALHTDIVESMSSSAIINAFQSCFSVRNTSAQITIDPGTCFVSEKPKCKGILIKLQVK